MSKVVIQPPTRLETATARFHYNHFENVSNVKIPPPGFELPPERIANGDVSLFWIGIITKEMLQIFDAHGLRHYQAWGQKQVVIEHGDLVLIEGWELAGLNEIFADDEAGTTYWRKHVSVSNWPLLGYYAFERLLATLEHGKLTDLASFNLLPPGIQNYVATCMLQTLRDKLVFDARGIPKEEWELSPCQIASLSLDLLKKLPKPRGSNVPRDLTEDDVSSSALFPNGCWLPKPEDLDAAFADMESVGFQRTDGDDTIPAVLGEKLAEIADDK
ncbi:hypothetical protein C6P46_002086 [Rhodotorula mucilaginosa]|uniref:Uncharacterized protein n=1 Tax=Rhodotorula mucilaginosa TaxID=5537 RepID=A0A9P7B798_RHOMI|nr:hypothetical protein C6P46_002086 [Rhodotorula mucilaginosa]